MQVMDSLSTPKTTRQPGTWVKAIAKTSSHVCSWYLFKGEIIPYEFTEDETVEEPNSIKKHLEILEAMGYRHYGTTIRPIEEVVEV